LVEFSNVPSADQQKENSNNYQYSRIPLQEPVLLLGGDTEVERFDWDMVRSYFLTDIGEVREENQDSFYVDEEARFFISINLYVNHPGIALHY